MGNVLQPLTRSAPVGYEQSMRCADVLLTAPMMPLVEGALDESFAVHRLSEAKDAGEFIRTVGPRIRGLATSTLSGRVDAQLLDHLPSLEIIANFGVGYDNVDVLAAVERGIVVTNTPGVLDEEVADLTVGLLLATLRQLPQADRFVRDGRWLHGSFPLSPTLRGRRIGMVGLGNIGKAVARRLAAFDVPIAYHIRNQQTLTDLDYYSTLLGLAEASDVLIVTVPGGAVTRHLINAKVLQALGSDGVLINVSRGSVVDESALIAALESGTILGAGLDVFDDEPRVPPELIDMPQVVLLPHIGSASTHTRAAMGQLVVDNLRNWFEHGVPITPVPETQASGAVGKAQRRSRTTAQRSNQR
jgi:lactate dehydrogenase-like 2-hydroxyacid dehydrogenase